MSTTHESGYKHLFANKIIFQQFIETFIHENWVRDIDFSNSLKIDKSFISEHHKTIESDIIYEVKFRGQKSYVVILIEFQSTVARFMALKVLNYITTFYMDYVNSDSKLKILPPIFPIILYNGDKKRTAQANIVDLIEFNDLLGKFSLNFEYCKIAISEYSQEKLTKIQDVVSTLLLAENCYDMKQLEQKLLFIFQQDTDTETFL